MKLSAALKIIISVALISALLFAVDFHALKQEILGIPSSTITLVIVGYAISQIISSYKWWCIARSGQIRESYPTAMRAYFIGMFVNLFGLGMVGGDLARGLMLGRKNNKTAAIASVIADRAHGLLILAIVGLVAVLLFGKANHLDGWLTWSLIALAGTIVAGWLFGPALLRRLLSPSHRAWQKLNQAANAFPRDPATVLWISAISVVFHLLQISLHYVMLSGLGLDAPWELVLVVIPFCNIFSSLPISWNGLGVRENAYVFFLYPVVLQTQSQAVAMGAMWLLAVTISSAIGGVFAFFARNTSEALELREAVREGEELATATSESKS